MVPGHVREGKEEVLIVNAVVFDLDNTIVQCSRYYRDARMRVYDLVRPVRFDLSWEEFDARFRRIDLALMETPLGFQRQRFPTAACETYRLFCAEVGHTPTPAELNAVWDAADSVFSAPYEPYPGAIDTLEWCRSQGFRMALCTKGDIKIQQRKIEPHNLGRFFDHISIVPKKHAAEIGAAADTLGIPRDQIVMVGDSLREDIDGAKVAGLRTVWVMGETAALPELYIGNYTTRPDVEIEWVSELPRAIRRAGSARHVVESSPCLARTR